MTDNLFR